MFEIPPIWKCALMCTLCVVAESKYFICKYFINHAMCRRGCNLSVYQGNTCSMSQCLSMSQYRYLLLDIKAATSLITAVSKAVWLFVPDQSLPPIHQT